MTPAPKPAKTARPAASPSGPPWAPAPEPERTIGPLPVVANSALPPDPGPGIRVPGDMAALPAVAPDSLPPAPFDFAASPDPDFPPRPAAGDDSEPARHPGLPRPRSDLPARQSLGFAAAPVPVDYAPPQAPDFTVPSRAAGLVLAADTNAAAPARPARPAGPGVRRRSRLHLGPGRHRRLPGRRQSRPTAGGAGRRPGGRRSRRQYQLTQGQPTQWPANTGQLTRGLVAVTADCDVITVPRGPPPGCLARKQPSCCHLSSAPLVSDSGQQPDATPTACRLGPARKNPARCRAAWAGVCPVRNRRRTQLRGGPFAPAGRLQFVDGVSR